MFNFSKRFNTGYKQYITNFKGDFDNNDDDLKDAFRTLLVNYKEDNSNNKEKLINLFAFTFFTLVKSFITKLLIIPYIVLYAKTLADDFNNQVFLH